MEPTQGQDDWVDEMLAEMDQDALHEPEIVPDDLTLAMPSAGEDQGPFMGIGNDSDRDGEAPSWGGFDEGGAGDLDKMEVTGELEEAGNMDLEPVQTSEPMDMSSESEMEDSPSSPSTHQLTSPFLTIRWWHWLLSPAFGTC